MGATPHKFQCASCGSGMEWDPASTRLKCGACKSEREIVAQGSVDEIPFGEFAGQGQRLTDTALEVKCSSCGASTQFEPGEVASKCPFCATSIVVQPKAADPLIAPHGVLPFSVTRERATEQAKAWLGGLWFAPNDLKRVAQQDGMQGVYIPYWTFDCDTHTVYQGKRGEHYRDREGKQQVSWQDCAGAVACSFDDMLTPATTAVQPARLDAVEPWGLNAVQPYEPAFLAGFKAQRYQVALKQGFDYATGKMRPAIEKLICADIGGAAQQVTGMRTEYGGITFKHLLLPVWIGAYRYHGKVFQVVVNAQRGTVSGERPVSGWKVALAVLAALIVVWVWANAQQ